MVDNTELNDEEVQHSTFSGDSSVDFSALINVGLSDLSNGLLLLDSVGGLLGDLQAFNQSEVLKDGGGVCVRQVGQQFSLKSG